MWRVLPNPLLKLQPFVACASTRALIRKSSPNSFPRDFSSFISLKARDRRQLRLSGRKRDGLQRCGPMLCLALPYE